LVNINDKITCALCKEEIFLDPAIEYIFGRILFFHKYCINKIIDSEIVTNEFIERNLISKIRDKLLK